MGSGVTFISEPYSKVLNVSEWTLFTEWSYLALVQKYLGLKIRKLQELILWAKDLQITQHLSGDQYRIRVSSWIVKFSNFLLILVKKLWSSQKCHFLINMFEFSCETSASARNIKIGQVLPFSIIWSFVFLFFLIFILWAFVANLRKILAKFSPSWPKIQKSKKFIKVKNKTNLRYYWTWPNFMFLALPAVSH